VQLRPPRLGQPGCPMAMFLMLSLSFPWLCDSTDF
jgi:hypothetical protein